MRDPNTGWTEADITINGIRLTFAQSMVVRVAVTSFRMYLSDQKTREFLGKQLADGYDIHLQQVEELMR